MRSFVTIWFGQTISFLGTRITGFALTLWIFEQTEQATSLAMVVLSFGVSSIIVNLFAGAIVDQFNRKLLIWTTDTVAGLITVGYLALFLSGQLELWHIYAGTAVRGELSSIQQLAYSASVSLMVPKSQYVRTSSMQTFTRYAGNIIGPGLGAALYETIGISGVMIVDIATFLIAVTIVLLNHIPQPDKPSANDNPNENDQGLFKKLRHSFGFGIQHLFARPGLRALLLTAVIFNFFDGIPNAVLSPMALTRTNNDAATLAAIGIASGIGGVAMSVAVAAWGGPKRNRIVTMLLAMMTAGIAKIIVGISQASWGWVLFSGVASATFPLSLGAAQAIWLAKVSPSMQGRVFAARSIMNQIAVYLGFGLAALLGDYLFEPALTGAGWLSSVTGWLVGNEPGSGFAFVFLLGGIGMAAVGIGGFLIPNLRQVELIEPDFDKESMMTNVID